MRIVLDTNILTRLIQPDHPCHASACVAVKALRTRGEELCTFPQVFYEFWVVCTRPKREYDGFGMAPSQALYELNEIKRFVVLMADPPDLYQEWERLVVVREVKGKSAHDARLAAALNRTGLTHLLTFNGADFARFPEIVILIPETLVTMPSSERTPDMNNTAGV